jgi:predicted TIM-barrel fold metal-dependent hydrolase
VTDRREIEEDVLEPHLPICDPHHHLWHLDASVGSAFLKNMTPRYLLPELLFDLTSGHNVVSSIFVDARAFYRADATPALAPVGETEFVNGAAAMVASGRYGDVRACAGIVGRAYLDGGASVVADVLAAHKRAGGDRFRGIRLSASMDPSGTVPSLAIVPPEHLYTLPAFQEGFALLREHELSFDAWLYHPQLPDLITLARLFPEQPIVLDHVGTPLGVGAYAHRQREVFAQWRSEIVELATCPNVWVKLGGLGMTLCGFDYGNGEAPLSSTHLADTWRPYLETCIEAFGVRRCMFESNYPVDGATCSYRLLWNAFKRITAGASADDKHWLYRGTAERFYRIETTEPRS